MFTFAKNRLFIMLFIVIVISAAFGAKGAAVESKQKVGITELDIAISASEMPHPELMGIFPMAAEQNQFVSYKYAGVGFVAGIAVSIVYLFLSYTFRETKISKYVRRIILINNQEEDLFISLKDI